MGFANSEDNVMTHYGWGWLLDSCIVMVLSVYRGHTAVSALTVSLAMESHVETSTSV